MPVLLSSKFLHSMEAVDIITAQIESTFKGRIFGTQIIAFSPAGA